MVCVPKQLGNERKDHCQEDGANEFDAALDDHAGAEAGAQKLAGRHRQTRAVSDLPGRGEKAE